jgi:hypothetical protein
MDMEQAHEDDVSSHEDDQEISGLKSGCARAKGKKKRSAKADKKKDLNNTHSFRWDKMFAQLEKYKEKHGKKPYASVRVVVVIVVVVFVNSALCALNE